MLAPLLPVSSRGAREDLSALHCASGLPPTGRRAVRGTVQCGTYKTSLNSGCLVGLRNAVCSQCQGLGERQKEKTDGQTARVPSRR